MWAFLDCDNVLFFLLLNMISDIYLRTGVFFQFIKTVLFEEGKTALFAITTVMQVHVNQVTHSLRHHNLPHSFTHLMGNIAASSGLTSGKGSDPLTAPCLLTLF